MANTTKPTSDRFIFPKWLNYLLPLIAIGAMGGAVYVPVVIAYGFSPKTLAVGYAPTQPVPYSHALHAGKLGIDCRYCHTTVEKTPFAAIPATQTCMNCHSSIHLKSDVLKPIHESWETGMPMKWVKVHNLPNYVYFNHSAHVSHGVGCIECHGRIDRMEVVHQEKPLSMGWCLDCHRDPGSHIRPKSVAVTDMNWNREKMSKDDVDRLPEELKGYFDTKDSDGKFLSMSSTKSDQLSAELLAQSAGANKTDGKKIDGYGIRDVAYMQSCYTCHR